MILIEKTQIMGLEPTIRGMRNPMNSWAKSDSNIGCEHNLCENCDINRELCEEMPRYIVGPNDLDLMLRLARAGSVDGKFRRMIAVYVDITAPLYWWKEFDTYKVGTVANSTSTMHKLHAKPLDLSDFSTDHLTPASLEAFRRYVDYLETVRRRYVADNDKADWYDLIQLLPSSYHQMRTVTLNYEVLASIYFARRSHKLDEWHTFCDELLALPYARQLLGAIGGETIP